MFYYEYDWRTNYFACIYVTEAFEIVKRIFHRLHLKILRLIASISFGLIYKFVSILYNKSVNKFFITIFIYELLKSKICSETKILDKDTWKLLRGALWMQCRSHMVNSRYIWLFSFMYLAWWILSHYLIYIDN